ncbi:hypothetical protein HDU97_001634 [Phlyctochytrium planicorne]|nr:hypothetical protein HDU97_001634 [Phlyctochytrium planicorne]
MASATMARLYHSTALLLENGVRRFATSGSDYHSSAMDPFEYRIEYFPPPYISDLIRPKFMKVLNELKCGQIFEAEYFIPMVGVAVDIKNGAATIWTLVSNFSMGNPCINSSCRLQ